MSLTDKDKRAEAEALNVEGILADFFLKKYKMRDSKSEEEKEYRKKSKKKHKSKKSKHKHRTRSRSHSSESIHIKIRESIEGASSSEEKDIKRLKKIKNLEARDNSKSSIYIPTLTASQNTLQSSETSCSVEATASIDIPYGPSLELLLTGTETNKIEIKPEPVLPLSDVVGEIPNNEMKNEPDDKITPNLSRSITESEVKPERLVTNGQEMCYQESQLNNIKSSAKNNDSNIISKEDGNIVKNNDCSIISKEDSSSVGKKADEVLHADEIKTEKSKTDVVEKRVKCTRSRSRSEPRSIGGRSHSRSRSKSRSKAKYRSHSRSRSLSQSRSKLKSARRGRSRSRDSSPSRSTRRSRSGRRKRSRSRSQESRWRQKKRFSRSRSRSAARYNRRTRSRSYSRDRYKSKYSGDRMRFKHNRHKSRSRSREHINSRGKNASRSRSKSREHESSRPKKTSRSRSRSKEYSSSRDKKESRSRSRSKEHKSSRSRKNSRSRSRSKEHKSSRSRKDSRSRSRSREHKSSRSKRESSPLTKSHSKKDSSPKYKSRSKRESPSKSREKESDSSKDTKIDQAKILQLAQKNVLSMIEKGTMPEGLSLDQFKKEQLVSIKSGGKSVQELTDFCTQLSKRENDPVDETNIQTDSNNQDSDTGFIHHPFKLKEQPMIKLNIKNAVQIPIKTHAEKFAETAKLSSQFPVSSGNQHKQKELEWILVEPDKSKTAQPVNEVKAVVPIVPVKPPAEVLTQETVKKDTVPTPVNTTSYIPLPSAPPPALMPPPLPPSLPPPPPPLPQIVSTVAIPNQPAYPLPIVNTTSVPAVSYPMPICSNPSISTLPSNSGEIVPSSELPTSCPVSSTTFQPTKHIDISSIVTKRFKALTKLQADPNDVSALQTLQEAQTSIQEWVQSQQVPGLFTGSTDAKLLTVEELCGPRHWNYRVKRDIFARAAPVTEGKGMSLLKKMGWNPGEGLGKNKEGSLEPLVLDIKTDKKGLVSEGEGGKKGIASTVKELQGKHPVSALMELCSKRKWKPPLYTVVKDQGPPHRKIFLFKVEVNGVEHVPATPSSNKKIAKADAAVVCLQALNVFPK